MAYCWLPAAHCLAQSLRERGRRSPPTGGPPGPRHLSHLLQTILALLQSIAGAIWYLPQVAPPKLPRSTTPPATDQSPPESSSAYPYPPPDRTNPIAPESP